jgi:hypothetical protein
MSSRGKHSHNSGAPAVNTKDVETYLTDNSSTVTVIAIGHGTGDDGDRRRRKQRRFAIMGVAAVKVEPAASTTGERSRKKTSATGAVSQKEPSERITKGSSTPAQE